MHLLSQKHWKSMNSANIYKVLLTSVPKQNNRTKRLRSSKMRHKKEIRLLTAIATRKRESHEAINILDNFKRKRKKQIETTSNCSNGSRRLQRGRRNSKEILKQDPYFTDAWIAEVKSCL